MIVSSHAYLDISSGGTANDVTVNQYGDVYVSNGGTANDIAVGWNGRMRVYYGGMATGVTIGSDGDVYVSDGGVVSDVVIEQYGSLYVSSGGSVCMTFNPWNVPQVEEGGIITYTTEPAKVNYGNGDAGTISSGDTLSGLCVDSGLSAVVFSGGVLMDTEISSSGSAAVSSGGTAYGMTVNGGSLDVYKGGSASGVTVADWGYLNLGYYNGQEGGVASGITLDNGYLTVFSGGTAVDVQAHDGGIWVEEGGIMNSVTLQDQAFLNFYGDGASATNITAEKNTRFLVYTTPDSYIQWSVGGETFELRDGIVNDFTVRSNMSLYLRDGAASNVILESGGSFSCESGSVATDVLLKTGATVNQLEYLGSESVLIPEMSSMEIRSAVISGVATSWRNEYVYVGKDAVLIDLTMNGGELVVNEGGVISSAALLYYGNSAGIWINSGAKVQDLRVGSGGSLYVSGGGIAEEIQCVSGGSVYVESGASAQVKYDLWTSSYPEINVAEGGIVTYTSDSAKVYYGNAKSGTISSGDTLSGLYVDSGLSAVVLSGGVLSDTEISNHASVIVSSGGTANDAAVKWYGSMYVFESGFASGVTIHDGGGMLVTNGGSASNISVGYYSDLYLDGGTANDVTVNRYGSVYVSNGGVVSDVVVEQYGSLYVCSGGSVCMGFNPWNMPQVEEGGIVTYTSDPAKVFYGNQYSGTISSGDTLSGLIVSSGLSAVVISGGMINDVTVNYYGYMYIFSGGTANDVTVNYYGYMYISSGGTVNDVTVNNYGNMYISSGGTANDVTVNRYGYMYISSGGTVNDVTVNSGGRMYLSGGGTANDVTVYGYMYVSNGGVVSNVVLEQYGSLYVCSGGSVCMDFNPWNVPQVEKGGIVTYTSDPAKVFYGNQYSGTISSGDTLSGLIVNSGLSAVVISGGTANDVTVNSYCDMCVSSGGTINDVTVNSGGRMYLSGGSAGNVTLAPGASAYIQNGAVASRLSIASGAFASLYYGGSAADLKISSGTVQVSSGCAVNGAALYAGGALYVYACGSASSIRISSGGMFYAYARASLGDVTLLSGGYIDCQSEIAALQLGQGAAFAGIRNLSEDDLTIRNVSNGVVRGAVAGGEISGRLQLGSGASIRGLSGSFTLAIADDSGPVEIFANDLSQVTWELNGRTDVDLSGNYWGTTDLEEIRRMLGTGADSVRIDSVLSTWPIGEYFAIESSDLVRNYLPANRNQITITFSGDLDPKTVSEQSVRFESTQGDPVNVTSVTADGRTLTVTFDPPEKNGIYQLRLADTVKDVLGRSLSSVYFTELPEGIGDQLRLTVSVSGASVSRITPAGDVGGTVSAMQIYFTKAVDPDSLQEQVTIITPDRQTIRPLSIQMRSGTIAELILPELTVQGNYTVIVPESVRDYSGNMLDQNKNGVSGEAADGFSGTFTLTEVELSVRNVLVPETITVGQKVSVSWETINESGTALSGSWTDGVYLSSDARWDISDVLLAEYVHASGLDAGAVLTGQAEIVISGVTEGNYYLLVRSDIDNDEQTSGQDSGKSTAASAVQVTIAELQNGQSVSGTVQTSGDFAVYHIRGKIGEALAVTLDTLTDAANMELYVGCGYVPTREKFDQQLRRITDGHIEISSEEAGQDVYVMVYAKNLLAATGYTLAVDKLPMTVEKVIQSSQKMSSEITLTVSGSSFESGVTAELIDAQGESHAVTVTGGNSSTLFMTIEENTLTEGDYTLRLKGSTTVELEKAVTIADESRSELVCYVTAPNPVGRHMNHTLYLTVKNTGNQTADSPLVIFRPTQTHSDGRETLGAILTLKQNDPSYFWVSTMPAGYSDTLYCMVSGAVAGELQAGEEVTIPISYCGWLHEDWDFGDSHINWNATVLYANDPTPIDWAQSLSGSGLSDAEIQRLVPQLSSKYGDTWGSFSQIYAENLNNRTQMESLSDMLGAVVRNELGSSLPFTELVSCYDSGTDGSFAEIMLKRSFQTSDNELHSFGYGWSTLWETKLEISKTSDVTVNSGSFGNFCG